MAAQIERRGLAEHVRRLGFRDDLEKSLPCCAMALHPALSEGICGAALQAPGGGVPGIGSGGGGVPGRGAEDCSVMLVSPGDGEQGGWAIHRLLDDEELLRRLAEAGRGYVAERLSISAMVQGNLEVYREVLNRH